MTENNTSVLGTPTKTQSDSINELAAALSKAQGEIESAKKNSVNPHFKNEYADLAAVWDVIRGPLSKNGLSIMQTFLPSDKDIFLITTLAHSSGQFITSKMPLILQKNDMQGLGSANTYARRYCLAAMVGVAQEDDDGNGAGTDDGKKKGNQRLQAEGPKPAAPASAWKPTKANLKTLQDTATKSGWANEQVTAYIANRFKKKLLELTQLEANDLIEVLATKSPAAIAPAFLAASALVVKDQPRTEASGDFDSSDEPGQLKGYVK